MSNDRESLAQGLAGATLSGTGWIGRDGRGGPLAWELEGWQVARTVLPWQGEALELDTDSASSWRLGERNSSLPWRAAGMARHRDLTARRFDGGSSSGNVGISKDVRSGGCRLG